MMRKLIQFKEHRGIKGNSGNAGVISKDFSLLIRGLCCLIIVIHHYANLQYKLYGYQNFILMLLSDYGGFLGVGVFFFLSGYGVTMSSHNKHLTFTQILRQRYWKLIWPILILNSFYLLIRYYLGINIIKDSSDLINNLFNIKLLDRALWFVEILFYCYALFYIYAYIGRKINERIKDHFRVSVIRFITLTLMYGILTYSIKHIYIERFWYSVNIPMFYLGILYSEYCKDISKWFSSIICMVLFIIIVGLTYYFTRIHYISFANIGCALAAILVIIGISRRYYIVTAYNSLLGVISLEVYLTHYKFLNIISHDREELNLSIWGYLFLSLLIGYSCYLIFHKRIPTKK